MSKISPLAPLSDIHSVALDKSDLFVNPCINDIDESFVRSFDAEWLRIMQKRGIFLGEHERKILSLQNVASKLKKSKDEVKSELKRQTLFVRNNRDELEARFQQQKQDILAKKINIDEKQRKAKDMIATVSKNNDAILRWKTFLGEVDLLCAKMGEEKPTFHERAINLASRYHNIDLKQNATTESPLYVSKIEKILLESHRKMLKIEQQQHEVFVYLQHEFGIAQDVI